MRDRATSAIPRLMYERLDDMGLDYAVLYPTNGFGIAGIEDEDVRRGVCRGFNDFFATVYGPYADRMTVAGVIPMHTPEEALDELEHCARIGLKVVSIPQEVVRPIPAPLLDARLPWLWPGQTHYADTFGLDSPHDYDPVWQRFEDLGYAVNCHGALTLSPRVFSSPANFTYNHQGAFAQMKLSLCKSLYLGGVTRRFPRLPFAFLECGVTWACTLLANIVEIWEKRSLDGLDATDPRHVSVEEFARYAREYGPELLAAVEGDVDSALRSHFRSGPAPEQRDDYAAMRIERKQDLRDLFVPSFFFGCEGDDRTVAFAFSPANAFGARLQPVLSSDISHWDVRDMTRVVAEAHGLVEEGLLSDEDFRDFAFVNPVRLYTRANPSFFDGTPLEKEARAVITG
jgi:predicted TIM-barrel fold metal-dependent hydrolase